MPSFKPWSVPIIELEKRLAMTEGARVEVSVGVAGDVRMAFGSKVHALHRSFDAGVFSLEEGRIVFTGVDGQTTDVVKSLFLKSGLPI